MPAGPIQSRLGSLRLRASASKGMTSPVPEPSADRYHGFSLGSVCWGYRDIFARTLEALFEEGLIGDARPAVTETFFALMRCAEQQHFDYVLKEFLGALNPRTRWLLDLPGVFSEVTELGRELATEKLHYGIAYFRALGAGGLGATPSEVRFATTTLRRLRAVDTDLAMAFLTGYPRLAAQLIPREIDVFVAEGIRAFHMNPRTGLRFMEGTLRTSELVVRGLTQEARLEDMRPALEALLRALSGAEVEVGDLGRLDSDELIERGSRMVLLSHWLYLPLRVRHFAHAAANRDWYRLCGVVAAGMLALDSFPRIHGHPAFRTCGDLVGEDLLSLNLFQILAYVRVLRGIRRMWPGARRLVSFGLAAEREAEPPEVAAERLFFDLADAPVVEDGPVDAGAIPVSGATVRNALIAVADTAVNVFDTAAQLTPELLADAESAYPGLGLRPLRTFGFLPDFLYPGEISRTPDDALVADLKARAERRHEARQARDDARALRGAASDDAHAERDKADVAGVAAAYVYDEWSQDEGDYYRAYCGVTEQPAPAAPARDLPPEVAALAGQTRRVFEMLRPELGKEKHLPDGDAINVDRLTAYVVARREEAEPRVDFYEKPYRVRRDLATLILLDVSGSTGSETPRDRTIEIEKRAALILGHGLAALGDRFAICGFSGNGREQCEFFVYKDFDAAWDRAAIGGVLAAYPRSATRIGAALRHATYRLAQIPARQRLILLVTDGKPMDAGYDPNTRYAQYDVRMACEEGLREGVHTFCISTDDNSRGDMELMFPRRRFVILPDIRRLPRVLPRLYVSLTV